MLPLLISAPSEADIHIEDGAGRRIPLRRLVELPYLGLCAMPQFLIAVDEAPVVPGRYRLVRGPDDADDIDLTAMPFVPVAAELSATLSVEAHEAITPVGSLCARSQMNGRPFSRTAHLSFYFSAPVGAAPVFAMAVVDDPQTPGGLGQAIMLRPTDQTPGAGSFDLPLEDGADTCATVTVWDAVGGVALIDRLCAASAPETRTVGVRALVPADSPITNRGCSCSASGPGGSLRAALPIALLAVAFALRRNRRRPPLAGTERRRRASW